jgi:hypothetical protein
MIGSEFERFFSQSFPGFINTTADRNVPDFYNLDGNFWVETKVGNLRWGPRIQQYQIKQFKTLKEPVVYALGFHNFDNARLKLTGKTPRQQRTLLERDMQFESVVFMNNKLVSAIWDKDARTSKKEKETYLTLKLSMIRNIVLNRPFKRFGENIVSSADYYGFIHSDFSMVEGPCIGKVLHRQEDSRVLRYLEERRF